ncbi:hypothetical protein AB1Y20_017886 [Prymnesium parvum]|uniref:Uncharacterized protein n=1 Tax=Prymnesium parvum TaxID=97485 RepID=A0AB34JLW7_PRYPA
MRQVRQQVPSPQRRASAAAPPPRRAFAPPRRPSAARREAQPSAREKAAASAEEAAEAAEAAVRRWGGEGGEALRRSWQRVRSAAMASHLLQAGMKRRLHKAAKALERAMEARVEMARVEDAWGGAAVALAVATLREAAGGGEEEAGQAYSETLAALQSTSGIALLFSYRRLLQHHR